MSPQKPGRRRFLKSSAALAGLAAAGGVLPASGQQQASPAETPLILPNGNNVRPLGERSRYEKLVRSGTATNATTPLQDLHGSITPTDLHFYVNHEAGIIPDFDPAQFRLLIHGMVERPLVYTVEDLKRMPAITRPYFLECGSNGNPNRAKTAKTVEVIHGRTSCVEWTGVPLAVLLKEAGVKDGAGWVIAGSADTSRHSSSVPMEKAMSTALVAYAMNGEALRLENGYPIRLVLPGYYGRITVKWLNQLKVDNQPSMSTQDRHVHVDHSPAGEGAFLMTTDEARQMQLSVYAKSVITFPSGGQKIGKHGYCEISGLAWSGGGVVKRVEVSTDGGKTWKDAKLPDAVHPYAHTRFRFPWTWNGEETIIMSRCTDERGDVQALASEVEKNWGEDSGKGCTEVLGEDCSLVPRRANRAYVQPWRVASDGTVHNAFVMGPEPTDLHGHPEAEG